jgi:PKD repeat protein
MRKVILPLILLVIMLHTRASAQDIRLANSQYDIQLPEGRVHFPVNEKKLAIKFRDGSSEDAIIQYLNTSGLFEPYSKDWKIPAPLMYWPVLKSSIPYNEAVAAIKANSNVDYVAPVLQYKDAEQSLYDLFYVGLREDADMSILRSLAQQLNFAIEEQFPDQKNVYRCRINKNSAGNTFEIAKYLQSLDKFKWAEPDFVYILQLHTSDPFYGNQWGINNTSQYTGATAGSDMEVVNAWGLVTGSSTISVAIHDCWGSAAEFTHPDVSFAATYDAVGTGFLSSGFTGDAHGINCAGIISATGNNNVGTVGVAYGVQLKAVKIGTIINSGGSFSTSGTIRANATVWSYQNADIISNSTGGGSSNTLFDNAILNALSLGRNGAGTLFLSSSGNSNTTTIGYPSSNTNTIAVAASSFCDVRKSPNSCSDGENWGCDYGTGVDVAAPGIRWYSTDITGSNGYNSGDYYPFFNGTSSACPAAAGVVALIYSINPTLSAANARWALETTCEKVGGYAYNSNVTGQPNGTWSNDIGYGRVNAYQAVQAANCTGATNDNCSNAIALPLNSSCTYTNGTLCRATQSIAPSLCSGFTANRAADVWYTVTPSGTSGTGVTITCVSGTNTDVVLGIYSGSCTGLTLVQCVDATTTGGTETMTVTGLTSGTTYYVRVYDWDGSTLNTSFQICATQCGPTTPTVTPAGPVTICSGNSQTLTVSNPCNGCTYAWSGGGTGTTNSVNATGTYTATATNTCGTSTTSNSVSVTVDPLPVVPTITPAGPVTICAPNTQTLTISNPCTGCTFAWSGGGTGTTKVISTTSSTTVTATNNCGTSAASNSVSVTVNPLPVVPTVTPAGPVTICSPNSQTLTISNPCTGCTFAWSGGGTGTTKSVNTTSTNTVTATNSCGTSAASNSVSVTVTPLPTTPIVTPAGPLSICSNGSATLTVSNPCSGCTFDWTGGSTGTSVAFNTAGTYSATATNSCGTSAASNAVTLNVTQQPNNPTSANASPGTLCAGNSSTLTVNGTLVTGATWHWYTGSCGGTAVGTGSSISVTPGTTTQYYVRGENGTCYSNCSNVTVTVNPLPTANAGADMTTCAGVGVAIGSAFIPGNSYNWQPNTGLSNAFVAQPTATPLTTTSYTLTVTNTSTGCTKKDTVIVNVNAQPLANAGPDEITCSGYPVAIGTPLVTGYLYSWAPATALNSTSAAMPNASPTSPITYTLTVTNPGTGCIDMDTVTVNINALPTADAGPYMAIQTGQTVTIGGNPTGTGAGPLSYNWMPPTDLNIATIANPASTPSATTTYTVTVTDGNGCIMEDTVTVMVIPPCTGPVANFSASQVSGTCPLVVNFFDQSTTGGATTYQWTIYVDGGAPYTFTNQNPTGLLYTTQGGFLVELIVTDTCGSDTLTVPNYITIACPLSVGTVATDKMIDIFPNPTSDMVNINAAYADNGVYEMIVQNVLGQTIYSKTIKVTANKIAEKISLTPYADGIYMLQVKGNGVNMAKKIEKR